MTSPTPVPSPSPTSSSPMACITMTPGKYGHIPPEACNSVWPFSPSFPAAIAFTVMFGLATLAHTAQAIAYRKRFCWVLIMAATWWTTSFGIRAYGGHHQDKLAPAMASQLLFLLAPLWINAYAYMILGRTIHLFIPSKRLCGLKAQSIAKYFVIADIVSFLVQGVGGSMLSQQDGSAQTLENGKNIYMGGIGLQELFVLLFVGLSVKFHFEMVKLERSGQGVSRKEGASAGWRALLYVLYAALLLITVRIIFRLAEFSNGAGINNPIPHTEWYIYVFDAAPMLIAVILLSIIHPGRVLVGPDSEFPRLSRKEKKLLKKERKEAKKAAKLQAKMEGGGRQWFMMGKREGSMATSSIGANEVPAGGVRNEGGYYPVGDVERGVTYQETGYTSHYGR